MNLPVPIDTEIPQEDEQEKKPTLLQLLMALTESDAELEADFDMQAELLEGGRVKVDNYKYLADKLELHAQFLKKREEEYKASRQAVEKNRERLMKHLLYSMQTAGFDQFAGNEYRVKVTKAAPSIELKVSEPTVGLKIRYDKFVRVKYEWDRVALREAIIAGDESVLDLATLKQTFYPRFSIKKD